MCKIFAQRKWALMPLISLVVMGIWIIFIFPRLGNADLLAGRPLNIFEKIIFVIQRRANVLQFELPMMVISFLGLFRVPTQPELYLLVTTKRLVTFLLYNVFRISNIYIGAVGISTLAYALTAKQHWPRLNLQILLNFVSFSIVFMCSTFILGGLCCILAIIFNKVKALVGVSIFILIDTMIFTKFQFSLFIYHGFHFAIIGTDIWINLLINIGLLIGIFTFTPKLLMIRSTI